MKNNLSSSFNPKTIQDLLISPFTNGTEVVGTNGTCLYHDGRKWVVLISNSTSSFLETQVEEDAVKAFWKLESV